jgi:ribose transport system permease protein
VFASSIYVVTIFLCVVATVAAPQFASVQNLVAIARSVAVVGIIAVGQTYVAVAGGMADVSVGWVAGMATVVTLGILPNDEALGAVIAVALGLVVGLVNGALIGGARTNSVVTTIGTGFIVSALALWWTSGDNVIGSTAGFARLGEGSVLGIPSVDILFFVVVALGELVLVRTAYGRRLRAVGGSYEAGRVSGIRVRRTIAAAFVVSGITAAIAGVALAGLLNEADYSTASSYTFGSVAAVVVGGTSLFGGSGDVVRTAIGAIIIAILDNAVIVMGLPLGVQVIVTGLVIIGAVWMDRVLRRGSQV